MILKGWFSPDIFREVYAGKTPSFCVFEFKAAVARARVLVKEREVLELDDQSFTLVWILDEIYPGYLWSSEQDNSARKELVTTASALYQHKDEYKLDDVGNLTWPEYFGVLALLEIADALFFELFTQKGESLTHLPSSVYFSSLGGNAVAAVEAVCFGERILHETNLANGFDARVKAEVKQQISVRTSHAAIEKNRKVNELKQHCLQYWLSNPSLSKREAARRFYFDFLPVEKQILSKDNAVRTLSEALSGFEKKGLAPRNNQ